MMMISDLQHMESASEVEVNGGMESASEVEVTLARVCHICGKVPYPGHSAEAHKAVDNATLVIQGE